MVEQYRRVGTGVSMALVAEGENGLWTADTVDTPLFGGAYKIKMASHCVVPSCFALASSQRSPLTVNR